MTQSIRAHLKECVVYLIGNGKPVNNLTRELKRSTLVAVQRKARLGEVSRPVKGKKRWMGEDGMYLKKSG